MASQPLATMERVPIYESNAGLFASAAADSGGVLVRFRGGCDGRSR
jgi:hypothetical protein